MITAFSINLFHASTAAIRPKLIELLWLKGNLVHSGHLDYVRGRQATVAMRVSELLGIRRYRPDMRLRTYPQLLFLQRLLDYGITQCDTTGNMLTFKVHLLL